VLSLHPKQVQNYAYSSRKKKQLMQSIGDGEQFTTVFESKLFKPQKPELIDIVIEELLRRL